MAFIAKQQSLREWAELVSQIEITSLNQIQNSQFTSLLLLKLDPEYFKPIIEQYKENISLSQLFTEIGKYYSRQIGTNIQQLLGDQLNIYSGSAIEELWDLILGIAIKGRNREKNINTILRMRPQTQQQLMRIISKLIAKLGYNVSAIDAGQSKDSSQPQSSQNFNDTNIIIQLTQQNQQLREKLQQQSLLISSLNQKNTVLKSQIDLRNKQRRQIINIMIKQPISTKSTIYHHQRTSSDSIVQFIKDMINQIAYLNKELNKKEEKMGFFQDVNKDLKSAYTAVFMQLEDMKKVTTDHHVDLREVQKEIQVLRAQNIQYADRQKDFISKISDLEEQKFYLKQIVQRLQAKNNITEQKIQKIITQKKVVSTKQQNFDEEQEHNDHFKNDQKVKINAGLEQSIQIRVVPQRQATVRAEIDELKNPSLRNKLQREVSHLQKKLNSVQQQNTSLKKINKILEKVISQFTKESENIMKQYESQIQPLFDEFTKIIQQEKERTKEIQSEMNAKQIENQQKMKELLDKIKQKISVYDSKEVQYQKIIKKLEIERDQLMKSLKNWQQKPQVPIIVPVAVQKPKKQLSSSPKVQLSIPVSQPPKKQAQTKQQPKGKEEPNRQSFFPSIIIQQPPQKNREENQQNLAAQTQKLQIQSPQKNDNQFLSNRLEPTSNIAASIIMDEEEEQTHTRRRQYSFMGNRQSTYQIGEGTDVAFHQKIGFNKMSSIGSFIEENVQKEEQGDLELKESLQHVQIVDITQIQQQLAKIKQHYVDIAHRNQKICQTIISRNKQQKQKQHQGNLSDLISQYQLLGVPSNSSPVGPSFIKQYTQQSQKKAAQHTSQIILQNENKALKHHLLQLSKQRTQIQERLHYIYEQSSKSQTDRTKQQLLKLSQSISSIRNIMIQSQNGYNEMQQFIIETIGGSDRTIGNLLDEVQKLKKQVSQRDRCLKKMEEESMVLIGAMLEVRASGWKSFF